VLSRGHATLCAACRACGTASVPSARRAIENCRDARSQRFGGWVFGRSLQAFHGALPVAICPMPFRKGKHELPGFVEGFDCPAVGEGEGLRERFCRSRLESRGAQLRRAAARVDASAIVKRSAAR